MENTSLATVEFIEKIEKLVEAKKEEFQQVEVLGKTYVNKNWNRVDPKQADAIRLHSLTAMVDFIKTTVENNNCKLTLPLIIEASHSDMKVMTSLAEDSSRVTVAIVEPNIPNIVFNRYMDKENFIIQLQTCFEDSLNKTNLLESIKYISSETKVASEDNGVSQVVTMKQGSQLKSEVQINPIAMLIGYRTYKEIDQVQTMYLLRLKDEGQLALFEADGGSWQYEAQLRVSKHLKEELTDLIDDGTVVVIG